MERAEKTTEHLKTENRNLLWDKVRLVLLIMLIYALTFRDVLEGRGIGQMESVLTLIGAMGIPAFLWLAIREKTWRRFAWVGGISILIFCLAGMAGYFRYHYQSFRITLRALESAILFWLMLCSFSALFYDFPLRRFARHLSFHTCLLSAVLVVCTVADMYLKRWPRQVHRFGLGSIQIFYAHPSVLAVNSVVLLLFLLLLIPYSKAPRVMAPLMAIPLFMTLRIRILAYLACTALLALWLGLLRKRIRPTILLAGTAAGAAVGWKRLYYYYFSPYALGTARGQFSYNGIRIARDCFPTGAGFATFGSRAAQTWYSPLYYIYEMCYTAGLDPMWPSYACDTFWPMILGETGVIGLFSYLILVGLLLWGVLLQNKKGPWISTAALSALSFELLETTGALAFVDLSSAGIALVLGLIFGLREKEGSKA